MTSTISQFKHSKKNRIKYCFPGWAQTAQWQQSQVNFTSAESKFFWEKNYSVANSLRKMCFSFPRFSNVFLANDQQSINLSRSKEILTANCWFVQEVLLPSNRHQKRGLYNSVSNWNFDVQNKAGSKTKLQISKSKWLSQLSFRTLFSQKFETTEGTKFRQWSLHIKRRVEILSKTILTFLVDFFLGKSVLMTKQLQQRIKKLERCLENVISWLLKRKRETWKFSLHVAIYISSNHQWKAEQRFSGNIVLTFPAFFVYENQVRGKSNKYFSHEYKLLI